MNAGNLASDFRYGVKALTLTNSLPGYSKKLEWASRFINDNRKRLKCQSECAPKGFRLLKNHHENVRWVSSQEKGFHGGANDQGRWQARSSC